MYVNKYKINLSTFTSGTTDTYLNVPIDVDYQIVDNAELIDRVFVQNEVELAINKILDYDRVRFMPLTMSDESINSISYKVNLFDDNGVYTNYYGLIGGADKFTYNDVKFRKNAFTQTFLDLMLYDSDDPMVQNLVGYTTLFSRLNEGDLLPSGAGVVAGLPIPITQISMLFKLEDPLVKKRAFGEGFHVYYYGDDLNVGDSKFLYIKASFKNGKNGTLTNLMVKNVPQNIENLVHELYTRIIISRTQTGYYYKIDDTYQGNPLLNYTSNNVTYSNNNVIVEFYQVSAL